MSSGVILNGGAAESFSVGVTVAEEEPICYDTDPWEPEDLVATVQFLATLDESSRHAVQQADCFSDPPIPVTDNLMSSEEDEPLTDHIHQNSAVDDSREPLLESRDEQTPTNNEEKSIIRSTNKPAQLKRVSFGSTKGGSMVETLIYEKPLTEETSWNKTNIKNNNSSSTRPDSLPEENVALIGTTSNSSESAVRPSSASKVRVTYFECKRPLTLPSPEAPDTEWDDTGNTMTTAEPLITSHQHQAHPHFITRQISTESGQDNPFRPDGDLSREADELVELLKGGRPISEVLKSKEEQQQQQATAGADLSSSPPPRNPSDPSSPTKSGGTPVSSATNGSLSDKNNKKGTKIEADVGGSGSVEVQRGVVTTPTAGESQAEHVTIKEKSKCNCCVIQ